MDEPLVSVVIPAYNAAPFIRRAIDSVLAQTWKKLEIIVVDDGSTDETAAIASSYGKPVTLVQKPNGGPSSARNLGIRKSRGDWIAFLDADDYWLPEKLERQVILLREKAELGFCSTATLVMTPEGKTERIWPCPHIDKDLLHTLFEENAAIAGSTSSVLIRRDALPPRGPFDETLQGVEDTDLWMRLAAKSGYECISAPLTVVKRRRQSQSSSLALMREAAIRVMRKNRHLLPPEDRGRFWRNAFAGMLSDYAKWEYRSGRRLAAIGHLGEAILFSPGKEAKWKLALLLNMIFKRDME